MLRQLTELFGNLFNGEDDEDRRHNRYDDRHDRRNRRADADWDSDDDIESDGPSHDRGRRKRDMESPFDLE
jgi:hypothetical protein